MIEMRPNFIRIPRTTGNDALVRVDQITAILHDTEGKGAETRPILNVQLSTHITVRTALTEPELLAMMKSAAGCMINVAERDELI